MPVWLFALLTAPEANAHVPSWLKYLGELSGWTATFVSIGAASATLYGLAVAATSGFRKKRAADLAAADVPVAPMPVAPPALPLPSPATNAAPHDYEAELHAMRIQRVHLQDELTAVQESARNLRKAHDAATFDLAAQAKALYAERSANEELRQKCAALLAEMARLRSQGPDSTPPRGRRER